VPYGIHDLNGIHDLAANAGWVRMGMNHGTAVFAVLSAVGCPAAEAGKRYPSLRRGRCGLVAEQPARYVGLLGRENILGGVDCGLGTWVGHLSIRWVRLAAMAKGRDKDLWGHT
jgi:hypothetical protein